MYSIINCRQGGTVVETGVTNYRNQRDLPKSPKKLTEITENYKNQQQQQQQQQQTQLTEITGTFCRYMFTGCKNITFITLIHIFMIRGITKTFLRHLVFFSIYSFRHVPNH